MAHGTERSVKMLAAALEKEEQGRQFYKEAVSKCSNELGKQMFQRLMADEGIHIRRIKDIYTALEGGQGWSDKWKAHQGEVEDLQKLFAERIEKLGPKVTAAAGDIEALEIGIEMEQGAITFYDDHLKEAADPLEREFVSLLADEERGHYAALKDLTLYLQNPESWFAEKEHHGLDGA
ncbi:MAG: ferritin family protein [Pseudomonadota bacterium]